MCFFLRYVLECAECGVIYRSRQYWFGNDDPVNTVVRTELRHAWPGVRFGYYKKHDVSLYGIMLDTILWARKHLNYAKSNEISPT